MILDKANRYFKNNTISLNYNAYKFKVYQILIIAYTTGILWLRRNPLSLIFTAITPFSLLFVLFIISDGQYTQFAISGSLVMALVGYGLALGQDITYYKTEYKIQDMFVASPISPLTYMTGLALSEILFGFPALVVLLFLIFYIGVSLVYIPLLIFIILIVWISTSSMGFFLSSHMLHMKNATQIISFVNVFLAILPPVFYSINKLPDVLQYVSYIAPTTHASLMIQYAMGFETPENWSVLIGILVQLVYAIGFITLAKTHAMWRET
jgi:ABC-2 type transport system permease protein